MYDIQFSPRAEKDFKKLSQSIQKRVTKKLTFFSHTNPLHFSKPLVNLPPATHRFRVGMYRLTFYVVEQTLYIVRIQNRRDIYLA